MKEHWNRDGFKRQYEWTLEAAKKSGFTDEELESPYLDRLFYQTKSPRITRMISLAYWLGRLRGITSVDNGLTPIAPEKNGDVWAWVAFGNTGGGNMTLYFAKNGDDVDEYGLFDIRGKTNVFCDLDDGEWHIIDGITHWRLLPEPPKGAKG